MQLIDWIVLSGTLLFIVIYGTWKTRGSATVQEYIKGGNQAKWWTIGLSVMATQASAITFLSTPGQAFHSGMGFVQFYIGLPLAMIIISMVFIPIYHKLNVYTAYEYLESRFDLKTRTITALFFLIQRGLGAGITIFAPAIILSVVLGWNLTLLNIIIGILVILYTVSGGTKAVSVTQKQQMAIIFGGMFTAFFLIIQYLPEGITFSKALDIAGANGKMKVLDFSFDLSNKYTVWTGIIGGTFLMLSYFGTDQSQVQRYLSGKSVKESQLGLLFNGLLKVPMQFFILLVGVMVFVFYQFNASPLHFNPQAKTAIQQTAEAQEYTALEQQLANIQAQKNSAITDYLQHNTPASKEKIQQLATQDKDTRDAAKKLLEKATPDVKSNDKDFVFIHFILHNLPRGLIGLLLAVILSAAMSSTASELNALASTTTIDLYKRNRSQQSEKHYVTVSKVFTLIWGIIAILIACFANLFDNLIQLVNIIGSIFYGNVLGIFLIAFFLKFVQSNATFIAAIGTQVIIILIFYFAIYLPEQAGAPPLIGYLWLNAIGCGIVMFLAVLLQAVLPNTKQQSLN